MEDVKMKEGPAIGPTKDAPKVKRPGRDKESRMRDLSEEESSGDSDTPLVTKVAIPVKSYSSQGVANEEIESKSAKDGTKSREKDGSIYKSDNKQKKDRQSRDKRRHSSESSSRSSVESFSIRKSKDRKKTKSRLETGKREKKNKPGVSTHGLKERKLDLKIKGSSDSSNTESSDNSSQTKESKREGRLKAKKIKEAIIKRIFAKKRDSLMVSIERKNYEGSGKVGDSQKRQPSDLESKDLSPKESNNQISIGDGNEVSKGGIKVQDKVDKVHDSNLKVDDEKTYKPAKDSDSSDNSSDSERSKYRKRGKKVEKTQQKELSPKRMPSKDNRKKSSKKHGERKRQKRGSSVSSSSSSSSSKSMSDSSSSTSRSSSSSSTSKTSSKTSISKERSPSSSSTSSSSERRHKRKFRNKDSNKRRSRSPLKIRKKSNQPPRPKKIHVGHLTKNVNKNHLFEIFSLYGVVKNVDLPIDKYRANGLTPRGFAYVEYDKADDAAKALQHMNGGIIDGQKIKVAPVIPFKPRVPIRRMSPNRRPFGNWRYTPPFRSRGGGALMNMGGRDRRRRMRSPPRRRSPRRRTRSRSPIRRRRMRRTSHSSSR